MNGEAAPDAGARRIIRDWLHRYNEGRPHSALGIGVRSNTVRKSQPGGLISGEHYKSSRVTNEGYRGGLARHAIYWCSGAEKEENTGGKVPISRDLIERVGPHEVRFGAGDPD